MIEIYAIGKNKDKALSELEKEYIKRISPFSKINVIEFKDETNDHTNRESEVIKIKEKEGDRVLSKIKENDFVILLDLHGKMMDSLSFSKELEKECMELRKWNHDIENHLLSLSYLMDMKQYRTAQEYSQAVGQKMPELHTNET